MSNFLEELRRRKVFRVAAAYLVLGWVLIQVADTIAPMMNLPEPAPRFILFLLIVLFPVVVFLAWVFEIRPTDGEIPVEGSTSRGVLTVVGSVLFLGVAGYFLLWGEDDATVEVVDSAITEVETPVDLGPEPGSIAVLPFTDLSPDGDQEYFGDGIAEELLNVLAGVDALSVASRTSTFVFKSENRNIAEIANILNVAHVLEGSVRKAGSRLRITAQLIDAGSDRHLWSDTYERELTADNIFAIQDEIANAIVNALRDELAIDLEGDISVQSLTENLDAYDLYLQAKQLDIVASTKNRRHQLELMEQAVVLDPEFSAAWAELALNLLFLPTWDHSLDSVPWNRRAIEAAERAIALDPNNQKAYYALQSANYFLHEWEEMEAVLVRARSQIPDYQTDFQDLMGLGYLADANELAKMAAKSDPTSAMPHVVQGIYLQATGQHEAAIDAFEQAILHGYNGGVDYSIANSHWALGRTAVWNAINSDYFLAYDPELLPLVPYISELLRANMQDRPEVGARLRSFSNELGIELEDLVAPGNRIGLRVDDRTAIALGFENVVVDRFWSNMPKFWMWAEHFHDMRQSGVFRDRVRESGMLAYWQKYGWPDLCRAKGDDDFECD